jgi:hypothetical protein
MYKTHFNVTKVMGSKEMLCVSHGSTYKGQVLNTGFCLYTIATKTVTLQQCSHFRAVFLNRQAAARHRAVASIIPGRER